MPQPLKIAVNGAAGRMGQRVTALTLADPELELAAALEYTASPNQGEDAGEVCGAGQTVALPSRRNSAERVDAVIDFSLPEALDSVLAICEERKIPLVIATTGYTDEQRDESHCDGSQHEHGRQSGDEAGTRLACRHEQRVL